MGDFNSKVGEGRVDGTIGSFGLGERNRRGEKLIEWCKANDQVVLNTWFQQPKRRLWTWRSPDGSINNQIDYITINSRFRNGVLSAKTYPGVDCDSDHVPVVCDMRIKLKKTIKGMKYTKLDYKALKHYQQDERTTKDQNSNFDRVQRKSERNQSNVSSRLRKMVQ